MGGGLLSKRERICRGTEISNPSPSSKESANHRFLSGGAQRAATESAELSVREAVAGCTRDCAFAGISADQRQGIGSKPELNRGGSLTGRDHPVIFRQPCRLRCFCCRTSVSPLELRRCLPARSWPSRPAIGSAWSGATARASPPCCALRPGWCSPMREFASPSPAPQG
jgi:hypothetical protein